MRHTSALLPLVAFVVSLGLLTIPVSALPLVSLSGAFPLLGPSIPISTALAYQESPRSVFNATTGEYLVVWQDARRGVTNYDIYAQRISSDGALLGGNFAVAASDGNQLWPVVSWNPDNGEYMVLWTETTSNNDLYGQRIAATGELLGARVAVAVAPNHQSNPSIAWNTTQHEYLVVWADSRNGETADLYGKRLKADGSLLGADFPVSQAPYGQGSPDLVWNATLNEYLVVWQDLRRNPVAGVPQLIGIRLTQAGVPIGEEIIVDAHSSGQYDPAIAWNSSANEYLVTWTSDRYGLGPDNIYARGIDSQGKVIGNTFAVTSNSYEHSAANVAYNSLSDEYLITWSGGAESPCRDVYAQRVSADGLLIAAEIPIATGANEQCAPQLAWNPQVDQYLIVWTEYRAETQKDIFGQRLSGFGPSVTASPTSTATTTATPTHTPSPISAGSATPTQTSAVTPSLTQTPTATRTSTREPTATSTTAPQKPPRLFLPLVIRQPTPMPTRTPTRTATATLTATPTLAPTSQQPSGIYGRITYRGTAISGVPLTLWFWNGTAWSDKAYTTTSADGSYLFGSPPGLTTGQVYEVVYGPNTGDNRFVFSWEGPQIAVYTSGVRHRGGDFDIANINLLVPPSESVERLPVTFSWQRRGLPGDSYYLELFDRNTGDIYGEELGDIDRVTINGLPPWVTYGKQYGWYIAVCSGEEGCGVSFYSHAITFVQ